MHTGQSNTHRLRKVHCGKEANRTHTHKQVEGVNWFDTKHTILHPLIHFNQFLFYICFLTIANRTFGSIHSWKPAAIKHSRLHLYLALPVSQQRESFESTEMV